MLSGFDLSVMADEVYEDAIIDTVQPTALLSDPFVIKVMGVITSV